MLQHRGLINQHHSDQALEFWEGLHSVLGFTYHNLPTRALTVNSHPHPLVLLVLNTEIRYIHKMGGGGGY